MIERLTIPDDGIRLSAVLEGMDKEPRPLVIFLHGFTSSKDRPHNIASCEAMREAGFATLRLDLYGHGESGGEFKKHTLYKWISNTLAAMDYARTLESVTDLYLSGHSQGGLTAALAAGMAPDRVKGLILRAPAFMIPRCHVEDAVDRFPGPVLLLHGDEDDTVPLEDSVRAAARYQNCRLEIIPGETHHIDRHPGTMKTLIREWLRKTREDV